MTTSSQALIARADVTIAALDTGGGILLPEQSTAFIDMILDEPTVLKQSRVVRMARPKMWISRIGFDGRILRAARNEATGNTGAADDGSNDRYVRAADRVAPVTSKIELETDELIAEIHIPYEDLEDNIEGQSLEAHIMRLIATHAALDLEEWALFADTTSGDAYMALADGWLKRSSAHVADNLGAGINPDLIANALLAMPQKYLRYLPQMRGFISVANTIRYRQKISQRIGTYGDSALQQTIPLYAHGLTLEGAPMLASDGVGATGLVTFPNNLIFGIRRDISVETDKNIRSREYIIVLTMRAGLQVDLPDAVVKLENI